jgi:sugar/nucleoside kinase (ribokinase family)
MKDYDVYALGNALVDIEYHVDAHQLDSMQINKGVMTLIEESQHDSLVNYLGDRHEKMACGGSAANSLIAIAQMGGQGYFSCRVANDMTGQFFLQDLKKSGIDTNSHLNLDDVGLSGKCLVFVTPDADRTMNTYLGVSADLDKTMVSEQAIKNSEFVYLEGYLVTGDKSREAVLLAKEYALKHKVRTALTLSDPTMMMYFRDGMMEMIGDGVDMLFANEEEAFELSGSKDIERTIEVMGNYAETFAITRGKEGAVIYDGHEIHYIAPHHVDAVDTLGAGDMFAGAFLYGLTHAMDYREAGKLASLASSKIVTQFGPRLQTAQTLELLQAFKAGNF